MKRSEHHGQHRAPRVPDLLVLRAKRGCRCCGGTGQFHEWHGPGMREPADCDCALESVADGTPEAEQVERGEYLILPARDLPGCES